MDIVNNAAETVLTSAVIFVALITLGGWIFKWFATRVDAKDAFIREMTADLFEHLSASTQAMNELVREMREGRTATNKILDRVSDCPKRGAT